MLTENQYKVWCNKLNLSKEAIAVISNIRESEPQRRTDSGILHKAIRFTSRKMLFTIQAESATVAFPLLMQMEVDDDILEIYDEPPRIKISFFTKDKTGNQKKVSPWYTPDYFILRKCGFEWIEVKPEKQLLKLSEKSEKYSQDQTGRWRCIPGEEYANKFGGNFCVLTERDIHPILYKNIRFLIDFYSPAVPKVDADILYQVKHWVKDHPGETLKELYSYFDNVARDRIFKLIVDNEIFVDLHHDLIQEPKKARVYDNFKTAEAMRILKSSQEDYGKLTNYVDFSVGSSFLLGELECTILEINEENIVVIDKFGEGRKVNKDAIESLLEKGILKGLKERQELSLEAMEIIMTASPASKDRAIHRWQLVCAKRSGMMLPSHTESDRTINRYVRKAEEAERLYKNAFLGMFDKNQLKGNKLKKIDSKVEERIRTSYLKHYVKEKHLSLISLYLLYVEDCKEIGLQPICKETFRKTIKNFDHFSAEMERNGHKVANKYRKPYRGQEKDLEVDKPTRVFEILHIDHTPSIEFVCPNSGINLGVGYDSFVTDPATKKILTALSSLTKPNGDTNLLLMRLLVQEYGMLPQFIMVDGGSDFRSMAFEKFLAMYSVSTIYRKKGAPKDGAFIERMFGMAQTQFVNHLLGNIQYRQEHYREITKKNDPRLNACWDLGSYYKALRTFIHQYNSRNNVSLMGETPNDCHSRLMTEVGIRENRLISYNEKFLFDTMSRTRTGTAMVRPGLGVKINYIHHWCDAFDDPEIENKSLPVVYDPINAGISYAFVTRTGRTGRWTECKSELYEFFSGFSPRELITLASEYRKHLKISNSPDSITARKLVKFWKDIKNKESKLIKLKLQNLSNRDVLKIANLFLPDQGKEDPITFKEKNSLSDSEVNQKSNTIAVDRSTIRVLPRHKELGS